VTGPITSWFGWDCGWITFWVSVWVLWYFFCMETSLTSIVKEWCLFLHSTINSHWWNLMVQFGSWIWPLTKNHHLGCLIMLLHIFPMSLLCSVSKEFSVPVCVSDEWLFERIWFSNIGYFFGIVERMAREVKMYMTAIPQ